MIARNKKISDRAVHKFTLSALGVMMAGTSLASPALAQATDEDDNNVIVVTAQKREENLLEVPMAVSVVQANELQDTGRETLKDMFATVPGLNYNRATTSGGQQMVAIRGLVTNALANPTVSVTIGDAPYGSSTKSGRGGSLFPDVDPGALDHIEVLRGPQGTLYGASSIGGLLKFVLKEPTFDRVSGTVRASVQHVEGGDWGYGVSGAVNLPIASDLGIIVTGATRDDAGWVYNRATDEIVNNVDTDSASAVLMWQPAEIFTFKVEGLYQHTQGYGSNLTDTDEDFEPIDGSFSHIDPRGANSYDIKMRFVGGTAEVDLGAVTITDVASWSKNTWLNNQDISGSTTWIGYLDGTFTNPAFGFGLSGPVSDTGVFINDISTERLTNELRFSGTIGEILDWQIGGFYSEEDSVYYGPVSEIDPDTGELGRIGAIFDVTTTVKEHAVFGNATIHLSDRFDVQLGARQAWAKQTYHELDCYVVMATQVCDFGSFFSGPYDYPADGATALEDGKDKAFTFNINPRFRVNENLMFYARMATGFRIGGINAYADFAGNPVFYGPDKVTSYELGTKGSTLNGDLVFDLSAFYIDWSDMQLQVFNSGSASAYITNAGKVESKGLEATFTATPIDGLVIAINGSYNEAELAEDLPNNNPVVNPLTPRGRSGEQLPYGAKFQGSISVDKTFEIGDDAEASIGFLFSHVGKRFGEFPESDPITLDPEPRVVMPSYEQLDLRGSVTFDPVRVSAYVNNITDERGVVGAGTDGLGLGGSFNVTFIRPRTYGLSVAMDF